MLPERDPSLLDQAALGNQALQAQLARGEDHAAPGLDVVRDVALPKLERAILALQVVPREGVQVSRFVRILERSALGDERKQVLVDKLLTDQAAAEAVTESVDRWLGSDDEAWRSELVELLELSYQGLEGGEPGSDGWILDSGEEVALEPADDSVASRATGLVGDVAARLASEGVRERLGDVRGAVEGYVRTVVLALLLEDEEEEEEEGVWGEVVEES